MAVAWNERRRLSISIVFGFRLSSLNVRRALLSIVTMIMWRCKDSTSVVRFFSLEHIHILSCTNAVVEFNQYTYHLHWNMYAVFETFN